MHTIDDLFSLGIKQWENFDGQFDGSDILIGNGFSISLCSRLAYSKLYEIFVTHTNKDLQAIFVKLNTNNFELVIDALIKAKNVSEILNYEIKEIPQLINSLKFGLISSIQETHPTWKETNFDLLRSLSVELSQFNNVYTTNYDVFLYRIILAYNNLLELNKITGVPYEDSFYEEISDTQLGFGNLLDTKSKMIYYLHGSLFFFNTGTKIIKLRKLEGSVEFIRLIKREIDNDNFPIFVAEGNHMDKLFAINDNYYLSFCLNMLKRKRKDTDKKMVSFGFSFSSQDIHIANSIMVSGIKQMAVSIYTKKSIAELKAEISRINNLFGEISIEFYDSSSLFSFNKLNYIF
jgi:hypothetical protein